MARLEFNADQLADGQGATGDVLFQLGMLHASGRAGREDLVAAHMWFNLAAMRGSAEAARYRKELAADMAPEDVALAQRQAREWLSRH